MTLTKNLLQAFLDKVRDGNTSAAAQFLDDYGRDNLIADARDAGSTVFHVLAEATQLVGPEVLDRLPRFKNQVDDIVNVRDKLNLSRPALGTACHKGRHAQLVQRLLALGAKAEKTDGDGHPPLVLLGKSKGRDENTLVAMMHHLLNAGARLDTKGKTVRAVPCK